MTTVKDAEEIILAQARDYGSEQVLFEQSPGRVLAEDLKADRDLPPCNRVTMDGIAIKCAAFESGIKTFAIKGVVAAGDEPIEIDAFNECVEIMTGAALPDSTDTIVRYEDVEIKDGIATVITNDIRKGQNLHYKGKDKKEGETVATANENINPAHISMAASVGKSTLLVKKMPRVVIISTGDELVDVDATPTPYQVRRSNSYAVKAVLQQHGVLADTLHIPDEPTITCTQIESCLAKYDVILLSGGISMGKFDYVPQVLEELSIQKLFHKVQQRPGKPFWFGKHKNGVLVFAFPGNPVSTFMCLHRYFLPWLQRSLGVTSRPAFAELNEDISFTPALQYFAQVKLKICKHGHLHATPMEGHGSGDFANLLDTDAFMELPLEQSIFKKGEVYRIWPFKNIM